MSDQKSGLAKLITELRNRRVFRVAAVYLAVGFAILEATDIVIPMLGLPEIIPIIVLGLLMLGFPIATILSWHYQMTEEGLRKSPKSGEKQTSDHKPLTSNGLIIVLLALILVFLAYPRFVDTKSDSSADLAQVTIDPNSIAVLPFTSFADEREDEIFADGMHDDILTQLSKIRSLKVISRTTMMKYKDTKKSIKEIAGEVGVANLLEGSVRRAGDQVRIVAQLIKANTDEHLWAETYDRAYADIFSIQSDVAKKIASALKSALTPEEQAQLDDIPTANMKAYDLFLQGNHYWHTKTTKEGNMKAAKFYEEAIKLDPQFGLAYARLAIVHSVLYQDRRWDQTPERKALAQASLESAVALIPDHPETHFAQGIFYKWYLNDPDNAIKEFEIAMEAQPGNDEIAQHLGSLYLDKAELERAGRYLQKAYDLNPDGISYTWRLGTYNFLMRNYKEAEKYLLEGLEKDPESLAAYRIYAFTTAYGFGNLEKAREILMEGILNGPEDSGIFTTELIQIAIEADEYEEALRLVENEYKGNWPHTWKSVVYYLLQDSRLELELDSARANVDSSLAKAPDNVYLMLRSANIYAMSGDFDQAITQAKRAVEFTKVEGNLFDIAFSHYDLARIYAVAGESDLALETLEYILSFNNPISRWNIKFSPAFDSLRDESRYRKLMLDMS